MIRAILQALGLICDHRPGARWRTLPDGRTEFVCMRCIRYVTSSLPADGEPGSVPPMQYDTRRSPVIREVTGIERQIFKVR